MKGHTVITVVSGFETQAVWLQSLDHETLRSQVLASDLCTSLHADATSISLQNRMEKQTLDQCEINTAGRLEMARTDVCSVERYPITR